MTPQGLSFQYLPPFSIVSRFFVSALIFGVFGSLWGLWAFKKGELHIPVLVHLFTLGFMAQTMFGALFQMIPVVAGATFSRPLLTATVFHLLTVISALAVLFFLTSGKASLFALFTVLTSFLPLASLMLWKVISVPAYRPTVKGMRYSLMAFIVGLLIGLFLIVGINPETRSDLLKAHVSLMIFGWTMGLISSVAFQVIEMFFVTPPYRDFEKDFIPPLLLIFSSLFGLLREPVFIVPAVVVSVWFCLSTIYKLYRRKRKVPDPLIYLWVTGLTLLAFGSFVLCASFFTDHFSVFLVSLWILGLGVQSVIFAMMLRIIPFLVWMHLSMRGVPNAPTMFEVISKRVIWVAFFLQIANVSASLLSIASLVRPEFSFIASFLVFSWVLLSVMKGIGVYLQRITSLR